MDEDPQYPFLQPAIEKGPNFRDKSVMWGVVFLLLLIVSFVAWFVVNESYESEASRKAWVAYCEKNGWTYYGTLRVENPRSRFEACKSPDGILHVIPENL